jgi:hypothetical protein
MKCPFKDGWEGTAEEYVKHYDEKHSKVGGGGGDITELQTSIGKGLKSMEEAVYAENFDRMLTVGWEVLVDIGRYYHTRGFSGLEALANYVAIALLSASRGNWANARGYLASAYQEISPAYPFKESAVFKK